MNPWRDAVVPLGRIRIVLEDFLFFHDSVMLLEVNGSQESSWEMDIVIPHLSELSRDSCHGSIPENIEPTAFPKFLFLLVHLLHTVTNTRSGLSSPYPLKNYIKYPTDSGFLGQEKGHQQFPRKGSFCSSTSALQSLGKSNRKHFCGNDKIPDLAEGGSRKRNFWQVLLWCCYKAGKERNIRGRTSRSGCSRITFQEFLGIWEIQWNPHHPFHGKCCPLQNLFFSSLLSRWKQIFWGKKRQKVQEGFFVILQRLVSSICFCLFLLVLL